MGRTKESLEQQEYEDRSNITCTRCGAIIYKSDMEYARQSKDYYLCPDCRAEWEKIEKE